MIAKFLVNGEWTRPRMKGYRLGCCDCGLVHRINFRVRGRRVEFQTHRDDPLTAEARLLLMQSRPATRRPDRSLTR